MKRPSRRHVLAGALALGGAWPAVARDWPQAPKVQSLYDRALVLDTLMPARPDDDERRAIAAGLTGGVCDLDAFPRSKANALRALAEWEAAFADPERRFLKVLKADDFAQAKATGRFGVLLASQNADILDSGGISNGDDNLKNLAAFHAAGLRVLLITYTDANSLGDGYNEPSNGGLKNLGRAIIPEMNRLGMLVDVSHSGERTSREAIALSTRPPAVTHAGCQALYPSLRNKSDAVIRALADKGGYFGVYNMTLWMTGEARPTVDVVVDHIDHAVNIGGLDLVGFGSDHAMNGEPAPPDAYLAGLREFAHRSAGRPAGVPQDFNAVYAPDLGRSDRMAVLATALARRGYKAAAIEKILGGNFLRTFRDACG